MSHNLVPVGLLFTSTPHNNTNYRINFILITIFLSEVDIIFPNYYFFLKKNHYLNYTKNLLIYENKRPDKIAT